MNDYESGKWVGNATLDENCTNPKVLFESIVQKPEDVISHITYDYFDGSDTTVEYANSSKIMSRVDTSIYGRCFTFSPTEKMIKLGIKAITVQGLRQMSMLIFHTNGMFESQEDRTAITAFSYYQTYLDLVKLKLISKFSAYSLYICEHL